NWRAACAWGHSRASGYADNSRRVRVGDDGSGCWAAANSGGRTLPGQPTLRTESIQHWGDFGGRPDTRVLRAGRVLHSGVASKPDLPIGSPAGRIGTAIASAATRRTSAAALDATVVARWCSTLRANNQLATGPDRKGFTDGVAGRHSCS